MKNTSIINTSEIQTDVPNRKKTEALIKALKFLKAEWNWSTTKLSDVLNIPQTTLSKWIKDGYIPKEINSPDVTAIISLISIHKSLFSMFNSELDQIAWLETKHPVFKAPPLEVMSQDSANLVRVRTYLDYVRGRGA